MLNVRFCIKWTILPWWVMSSISWIEDTERYNGIWKLWFFYKSHIFPGSYISKQTSRNFVYDTGWSWKSLLVVVQLLHIVYGTEKTRLLPTAAVPASTAYSHWLGFQRNILIIQLKSSCVNIGTTPHYWVLDCIFELLVVRKHLTVCVKFFSIVQ